MDEFVRSYIQCRVSCDYKEMNVMKRTLCVITAFVLCMIIAVTTVAADAFVPSVTAKLAPEVVVGDDALVEVVNDSNQGVANYDAEHVVVTPVSYNMANDEAKEALDEAFDNLCANNDKLDVVMPDLVNVAAGANVSVSDLVVKDLFHVAVSDELGHTMENGGNALKLTLDAKVTRSQFVTVMVCINGKWTPVKFVVNADGSITCTMKNVGVIAILVKP